MTEPLNDVTADDVRRLLNYEPESGLFTWRGGSKSGLAAGSQMKRGYCRIGVMGRKYFAHRLAWLHFYGAWPKNQIDHIDGCRNNNRIDNLRDVTREMNCQNQRKPQRSNTHGYLGVTRIGNKWASFLWLNGKPFRVGVFDSPDIAHQAYVVAKRQLHPGCTL